MRVIAVIETEGKNARAKPRSAHLHGVLTSLCELDRFKWIRQCSQPVVLKDVSFRGDDLLEALKIVGKGNAAYQKFQSCKIDSAVN